MAEIVNYYQELGVDSSIALAEFQERFGDERESIINKPMPSDDDLRRLEVIEKALEDFATEESRRRYDAALAAANPDPEELARRERLAREQALREQHEQAEMRIRDKMAHVNSLSRSDKGQARYELSTLQGMVNEVGLTTLSYDTIFDYANMLTNLGNNDEATQVGRYLIENNRAPAMGHYVLGNVFVAGKEKGKATKEFERAIKSEQASGETFITANSYDGLAFITMDAYKRPSEAELANEAARNTKLQYLNMVESNARAALSRNPNLTRSQNVLSSIAAERQVIADAVAAQAAERRNTLIKVGIAAVVLLYLIISGRIVYLLGLAAVLAVAYFVFIGGKK